DWAGTSAPDAQTAKAWQPAGPNGRLQGDWFERFDSLPSRSDLAPDMSMPAICVDAVSDAGVGWLTHTTALAASATWKTSGTRSRGANRRRCIINQKIHQERQSCGRRHKSRTVFRAGDLTSTRPKRAAWLRLPSTVVPASHA